jgi:hypothetical protein
MISNRPEIPANMRVRERYDTITNVRNFRQFRADSGNESATTAQ